MDQRIVMAGPEDMAKHMQELLGRMAAQSIGHKKRTKEESAELALMVGDAMNKEIEAHNGAVNGLTIVGVPYGNGEEILGQTMGQRFTGSPAFEDMLIQKGIPLTFVHAPFRVKLRLCWNILTARKEEKEHA